MLRFVSPPVSSPHRALQPPGWLRDWHIGVRVIKSGKLIGFISGVPAHIRVYDQYVCAYIICLITLQYCLSYTRCRGSLVRRRLRDRKITSSNLVN